MRAQQPQTSIKRLKQVKQMCLLTQVNKGKPDPSYFLTVTKPLLLCSTFIISFHLDFLMS